MFWVEIWKIPGVFIWFFFSVLVVNFSEYSAEYSHKVVNFLWAAPCENVSSDIYKQQRPRSSLSTNRIIGYYRMFQWRAKTRMIRFACAQWSECTFCACPKARFALSVTRIIYILKTYLYNFDPLKPHFYIVKLGFTGVYIIFLISARKHRLWELV